MPVSYDKVEVDENGLIGDHFQSKYSKKRAVTFIQKEHIDVVSSIMKNTIDPSQLRRNVVVSGINLLSLKGKKFQVGTVIFEGTGACHPCSRMEENLGQGGWNAMRGHGGLTARVTQNGLMSCGDDVKLIKD